MVVFSFNTAKPEAEGRLKSLSDEAVAREGKENLVQRKSHPNFETFDCIMSKPNPNSCRFEVDAW